MFTLIQKIIIYALLLVIGVSLAFNVYYHFHVKSLNGDIAALKAEVKSKDDDIKSRDAVIADQNNKIKEAQDKSKDFDNNIKDLSKQLDQKSKENQDLINKLKSQPAPKNCNEVVDYLKKNLELYQW